MVPERRLWSAGGWYLLHLISYFYHPTLYPIYQKFYRKLGIVLPCEKCRHHYRDYRRRNPFQPDDDLILWTLKYHNEVNTFSHSQKLDLLDLYQLFHVQNELPIHHEYIWIFLKVLHLYHQETDHLPLYREFLRAFREVMPCRTCRCRLAELTLETSDISTYLKIIKSHQVPLVKKVKFLVK